MSTHNLEGMSLVDAFNMVMRENHAIYAENVQLVAQIDELLEENRRLKDALVESQDKYMGLLAAQVGPRPQLVA